MRAMCSLPKNIHWIYVHMGYMFILYQGEKMKKQNSFLKRMVLNLLVIAGLILIGSPGSAQISPPDVGTPDNSPSTSGIQDPPVPLPLPAASGGSPDFAPQSLLTSLAQDDRYNTDPTDWLVYEHQTITDVSNLINLGYRVIDISVESFSPSYLFTVTYVANSNSYAKSWWWYVGVDAATLSSALSANNARLTSLKAYDIGSGTIRFTAIMISNTGEDATSWWWYYDQTVSSITSLWQSNNARLTQVNAYVTGGQTRYAVVMVDNSDGNNMAWWWYVNASVGVITSYINSNNARLVDLDPDPSTGNFNVIMTSCAAGCPHWWWYIGVPTNQLLDLVNQNGARIIDVNTVSGCGDACFNFLLINNSNAITTRVGDLLRNGTDGTKGLFLKQVGGPVLANLMDTFVFEPASTIKAAVHLKTMLSIQSGPDTLATQITKYLPPVSGSCPGTTPDGTEDIQTADREMMWHSDNTRTAELVDHYGIADINKMMNAIGMNHSSINHVIGCGGPIPNQTTLDDLALLYDGVANGSLLDATHRTIFFNQMAGKAEYQGEGYDWTGLWTTDLPNIINQEAPAGMSSSAKNWFRGRMDLAYKAGNYKICTNGDCSTYVDHISIFGYAQIPFCDASGPRQYDFGIFITNSTSDASSSATFTAVKAELLREQIHAGLASCSNITILPLVKR